MEFQVINTVFEKVLSGNLTYGGTGENRLTTVIRVSVQFNGQGTTYIIQCSLVADLINVDDDAVLFDTVTEVAAKRQFFCWCDG